MIVVDTNVLAYFVNQSELTELAEEILFKDNEWAAPSLWRSELRNVFLLYIRRETLDLPGAVEKFAIAEQLVGDREFEINSTRVLELATMSDCTAYDCEFVYLAEKLKVPLVTSDKKVLKAFPDVAVSMEDFIVL